MHMIYQFVYIYTYIYKWLFNGYAMIVYYINDWCDNILSHQSSQGFKDRWEMNKMEHAPTDVVIVGGGKPARSTGSAPALLACPDHLRVCLKTGYHLVFTKIAIETCHL